MQYFIVKDIVREMSLKEYLRKFERVSANLWKKIKSHNEVWINDEKVRPTWAMVNSGDCIRYNLPISNIVEPIKMNLDILFEDEYLLIVGKSAGMLTHPLKNSLDPTLANGVAQYYLETNQKIGIHPVYRLDRNTSGIVVFAKWSQIQQLWSGNHNLLKRSYIAIVEGRLKQTIGSINAPISRKENSIIEREINISGQEAITHYDLIDRVNSDFSIIRLHLETGRTHQIRVHMSSIGHPLCGDDLYGGSLDFINRHALHANSIEFIHPYTNCHYKFELQIPNDMQTLIMKIS